MKIAVVFGTRPEWIKLSPLLPLLEKRARLCMIHTGQHYSPALDSRIRRDLGLRLPNHRLRRGRGDFSLALGRMLPGLERVFRNESPDLVVVQGDTNSSLAGAMAAARLAIPVAHVEAGCRSGNLSAPEEQNRRMIDSISTLLFCADEVALSHLRREGRRDAALVGSTGVDAVLRGARRGDDRYLQKFGLEVDAFALATLHRAENTESARSLAHRLQAIEYAATRGPTLLALHPRTANSLQRFRLRLPPQLQVVRPLSYLEFLSLLRRCRFVLSDSGGIQEEAAVLGRPCLILRDETEWSRLVEDGRNFLVPRLGSREKNLIRRLWSDDAFLRRCRTRPSSGLTGGASRVIADRIFAWRRKRK